MSMFGLSQSDAEAVAPLLTQGIVANYAGDELPSAQTVATINTLLSSSNPTQHQFGLILAGLWYDLPPQDCALVLPIGDN